MTWLEFETDSGRIVCEVKSGGTPTVMEGHDVIPAPEDWDGDILGWTVVDGALARARTTKPERVEHDRVERIKDLMNEFIVALLDEDAEAVTALKAEFRRLKAAI